MKKNFPTLKYSLTEKRQGDMILHDKNLIKILIPYQEWWREGPDEIRQP